MRLLEDRSTLDGQDAEHLFVEQAVAGDDLGIGEDMWLTAKIGDPPPAANAAISARLKDKPKSHVPCP